MLLHGFSQGSSLKKYWIRISGKDIPSAFIMLQLIKNCKLERHIKKMYTINKNKVGWPSLYYILLEAPGSDCA